MAFDWGAALGSLGNWAGDNGMGLLTAGSTAANLGAGIHAALSRNADQSRLERLMRQGPNVGAYYQPMSEAEHAAFRRGVMANYQQGVPPGGYLDRLTGEALAGRESERMAWAQQAAYNDWIARLQGRQSMVAQNPGLQPNVGQPLAQYMLWRQIQAARQRAQQPLGTTPDMSQYGAAVNPNYSLYGGGTPGNTFSLSPNTLGLEKDWLDQYSTVGLGSTGGSGSASPASYMPENLGL